MPASCRLLCVATFVTAAPNAAERAPRSRPEPVLLFLAAFCRVLLRRVDDRTGTDRRSPPHAGVTHCHIRYCVARQRAWHPHPPGLRLIPSTRYNYRLCRDNPPQFYGMLCHEVFAPHRRLHTLRVVRTPKLCVFCDYSWCRTRPAGTQGDGRPRSGAGRAPGGTARKRGSRAAGPAGSVRGASCGATEEVPPGARAVQNRYGCLCTPGTSHAGFHTMGLQRAV